MKNKLIAALLVAASATLAAPAFAPSFSMLLLWACLFCPAVFSTFVPFMDQGFFFGYTPASEPVPIPVTRQCDTININWARGAASGPNPTAPYYLQIYSSTFIVPFIVDAGSGLSFNWTVPFTPGTLYQICMFDSNGVTGGCQDIFTVIPSNSTNSTATPSCANVTFPAGALDVVGVVHDGPMSQYGWVDQCTDLSVTPKNGTPPFIFTIATTLHPPVNITSKTMDAINWTVSLSWASSFFVSVVDSQGNFWANGPMHSGGDGPTGCLALDASLTNSTVTVSHATVAVGAGVGGAVAGSLLGILASIFCLRRRNQKPNKFSGLGKSSTAEDQHGDQAELVGHSTMSGLALAHLPSESRDATLASGISSSGTSGATPSLFSRLGQTDQQFHVEPFVLSSSTPHQPSCSLPEENVSPTSPQPAGASDMGSPSLSQSSSSPSAPVPQGQERAPGSQVYVVHHDGGRPPVTVYTPDGTEVVELPPRYADSRDPPPQPPQPPQPRRLPAIAARKSSQSETTSNS